MLNLTDHLRRLRVDKYEYVAMKVIVLLQSGKFRSKCIKSMPLRFFEQIIIFLEIDTSDLRESEQVRGCQEKALHALQTYTLSHYPDAPSKFGELLLRIPELQRTCQVNNFIQLQLNSISMVSFVFHSQVGKEMLTIKSKDGSEFNLLLELLRGEH